MEIYNKRETQLMRWLFAILLLVIFAGLTFAVKFGYTQAFDDAVRYFVYSLRADWLTSIFKAITFMANPLTLAILCVILLICPWSTLKFGIPISVVTGLGALAHKGLKLLILRERPDVVFHLIEENGYSFPSGHANASLVFYVFLAFLIGRLLKPKGYDDLSALIGTVFGILIFLIGVSRVYLGIHYPTDILGGWCLGGLLLIIFVSLYDAIYPMKYHLGLHTQQWSRDYNRGWIRPEKHSDNIEC